MTSESLTPQQDENKQIRTDQASSASESIRSADTAIYNEDLLRGRKLKRLPVSSGNSRFIRKKSASKSQPQRIEPQTVAKTTRPEDLVGASLAGGRYRIISQFGSGSMAYVFRASDNRLETDVVVKVPKPEKITTDDFRERFRRESQLLVRLFHPHVVKVLDVGEHAELPYVVMQLLSGGTLSDRMKNDSNKLNQMAPESLQLWIREVARALDFCFKRGMVHRDVKPANILFDSDDNAYVSDFGLTKIMHGEHTELNSSGTASGVVLGTPNYLSPEIILGGAYDGRADQYSLGITVYHALCGRPPMQGKSATATMINQTQKKLELLSSFRSDIPRELALAVQKSIEKSPKNRFSTCEEFAEAVLDGLRPQSSSSQLSIDPSILTPGSGESSSFSGASSKSSSVQRKVAAKPQAKKNVSSASSSAKLSENWLEPAPGKLPPRKKPGRRPGPSQKKGTGPSKQLVVFGIDVHPFAALAAGVVFSFSTIVYLTYYLNLGQTEFADSSLPTSIQMQAQPQAVPASRNTQPGKAKKRQDQPEKTPVAEGNKDRTLSAKESQPAVDVPSDSIASTESRRTIGSLVSDTRQLDTTSAAVQTASIADSIQNEAGNTGIPIQRGIIPGDEADTITFGPTGCPVVIVGNRVWSISKREVVTIFEDDFPSGMPTSVSADGKLIAVAGKPFGQQNTDVTVWDSTTGKKVLTAEGDPKRFVDTLLLTQRTLYVGDRWSDVLLVWDCETGKKRKPQKISGAKLNNGNSAVSHDGNYIAAVIDNQLAVTDSSSGNLVAQLERHFGNGKAASNNAKAQAVYAALQSLSFSGDNQEIAAISTLSGSRILCWNSRGEIALNQPASADLTDSRNPLQWFPERKAWLVGNRVFDRESARFVLHASVNADTSDSIGVYDDRTLCGRFSNQPNEIQMAEVPWGEIDAALAELTDSKDAKLHPNDPVTIRANLFETGSAVAELQTGLEKALKSKITSNGLQIGENHSTLFLLRIELPRKW